MYIGKKTTTACGEQVEIASLGEYTATVYQLDDKGKRIKRYRADGYLMGRLTIKEIETLAL